MADSDSIKLCECGCGEPAPIADMDRAYRGVKRGQQLRFVAGHSRRHVGNPTHGWSNTPTYKSWLKMRERCRLRTCVQWPYYGGRGITVCERWASFENFLSDMGERPQGTSLDRVNNDGNYEPGNVRWAAHKTQLVNRSDNVRVEIHGRSVTLSEAAEQAGLKYDTLRIRYWKGERGDYLVRPARHLKKPAKCA